MFQKLAAFPCCWVFSTHLPVVQISVGIMYRVCKIKDVICIINMMPVNKYYFGKKNCKRLSKQVSFLKSKKQETKKFDYHQPTCN